MNIVDFKSREFYKILAIINKIFIDNGSAPIIPEKGVIVKAENKGKYGDEYSWIITDKEYPDLLKKNLARRVEEYFWMTDQSYVIDKKLVINMSTIDEPTATITIVLTALTDNIFTEADVADYRGNEPAKKQLAILKWKDLAARIPSTEESLLARLEEILSCNEYLQKIANIKLDQVSQLKFNNQIENISIAPNEETTFNGVIKGKKVEIECLLTVENIYYDEESPVSHKLFAQNVVKRLDAGKLGDLHNADYCLLVLLSSGKIVCFNTNNLLENWLAGKL